MMARARALLLSLLVMLLTMFLVNCSPYGCRVTFGNSTCTPSGSGLGSGGSGGGGGGGGGGTTIDASKASSLVYYSNSLQAAGFGGTTFLPLTGYTPPATSSLADELVIVNKKFLYSPTGGSAIEGFSIDRNTGILTPIPGSPFATPGGATADGAWSDPQGRFLFVGSEGAPSIWAFQINATTGALTLSPGSPFTTGFSSADIITVDASGKFLYAGQSSAVSGVAAFSINQSTGALTPISGMPFFLGIAQIHASPAAEFLLGVTDIQDSGRGTVQDIFVYAINPTTGVPSPVTGSPFLTSAAPFDFAISPNGKFVYTFGTLANTSTVQAIEGFSMNTSTGALASLGAPFTSLPTASGCQFDQSGVDMFCVDLLFPSTKLFVLGASPTTGGLTHVVDFSTSSGFPFAVTD